MGFMKKLFPDLSERAQSVSSLINLLNNSNVSYGGSYYSGYHSNYESNPTSYDYYAEQIYKGSSVVYAVAQARAKLFSEINFKWRPVDEPATQFNLFGTKELSLLEEPWPGGTTKELLKRAIQDVDIHGNSYWYKEIGPRGTRLRRLRPDWVEVVLTASADQAVDADIYGYVYHPGGKASDAEPLIIDDLSRIIHWAPEPDPSTLYLGMSWLTTIVKEVCIEQQANTHLYNFFKKGAQLGIAVMVKEDLTEAEMIKNAKIFKAMHAGAQNAYEPLFLGPGSDLKTIQADLSSLDLKTIRGHVESHIAAAGGVPSVVVGLAEGQNSSALTQGNFQVAAEGFVDRTMRDMWSSFCGAAQRVLEKPTSRRGNVVPAKLWYSDADVSVLNKDRQKDAEILATHAKTVASLLTNGVTMDSAKKYVTSGNINDLEWSGYLSVQLWEPGVDPNAVDTSAPVDNNAPDAGEHDPVTPKKS